MHDSRGAANHVPRRRDWGDPVPQSLENMGGDRHGLQAYHSIHYEMKIPTNRLIERIIDRRDVAAYFRIWGRRKEEPEAQPELEPPTEEPNENEN
jgi:hypothetical protein